MSKETINVKITARNDTHDALHMVPDDRVASAHKHGPSDLAIETCNYTLQKPAKPYVA